MRKNKINFFNNCYNIAALANILLRKNEFDCKKRDGELEFTIPITDRLNIITSYFGDHCYHYFKMRFERDGKYLSDFSYTGYLGDPQLCYLEQEKIAVPAKVNAIYAMKPNFKEKAKALASTTLLTEEEISAIIAKSQELTEMAREFVKADELGVPYKSKNFSSDVEATQEFEEEQEPKTR